MKSAMLSHVLCFAAPAGAQEGRSRHARLRAQILRVGAPINMGDATRIGVLRGGSEGVHADGRRPLQYCELAERSDGGSE